MEWLWNYEMAFIKSSTTISWKSQKPPWMIASNWWITKNNKTSKQNQQTEKGLVTGSMPILFFTILSTKRDWVWKWSNVRLFENFW